MTTLIGCAQNTTLVVYYSYTGNCEQIVETLTNQITADVIRIEPAEKNLDYAANNYALGSSLISTIKANPDSESSYPAIDDVTVNFSQYNNIIVVTPLWWSQMAAPMQTFLFTNSSQMAGKNIGLVVSSYSSSISGVENDCKRLVPDGNYLSESLWINNSNHSNRESLIEQWLTDVNFSSLLEKRTMNITINGTTKVCTLADNSSTQALLEQLTQGDITYEAHDYGSFEKVGNIGITLPQNNESITTEPGDVILYQGTSICLYYDENTWNFTRIGKIEGISQSEMKSFVDANNGNVTVTLSLSSVETGINPVKANEKSKKGGIYTIDGKQLDSVPEKGIYIENGVKKMKE